MKLIHSPEPQHHIEAGGQQAGNQYQGKQIDIKPGHHQGQKQKHDENRSHGNQGFSVYKSVQQNLFPFSVGISALRTIKYKGSISRISFGVNKKLFAVTACL